MSDRSCGRAREAAPRLCPSGNSDTLPAHTRAVSGWTGEPPSTPPGAKQKRNKMSPVSVYATSWQHKICEEWAFLDGRLAFTMISMALQREVPQYMAIPWFITNVMARTISANHSRITSGLNCSSLQGNCLHPHQITTVAATWRLNENTSKNICDWPSIGLLTSFLLAKTMST